MFDVSPSDSIWLRRNRERAHSDARQNNTLDFNPCHPLRQTNTLASLDDSLQNETSDRLRPEKTGAVSLKLARLAPTCRGYQRQNGKEGKRHAFKISESGWKPEEPKTVSDKHNGHVGTSATKCVDNARNTLKRTC